MVLVVDDDRHMLALLVAVLQEAGLHAVPSRGARAVVWRFEDDPQAMEDFDLVLTDQNMDQMSGTELSAWLTERGGPPVLLMSGHVDQELRLRAAQAGVLDVLHKPFPLDDLLQLVRCWMP